MTLSKVPTTIAELRRALPKKFYCSLKTRTDGISIHVWTTSEDFCFDADFFVDNPKRDKKRNIAAVYEAVRVFMGGEQP